MMVFAVIFAGIFAFFGDMLIRGWDFPYGWSPTHRRRDGGWGGDYDSHDSQRARGRDGGGGGRLLAIVVAVADHPHR